MLRSPFSASVLRLAIGALVVSLLLAGGGAAHPAQAQQMGCAPYHVVQPGENLFRIGLASGLSWTYLMQLNGLPNPNLIYVGEVLCLGTSGVVNPPPVINPPPVNPPPVINPAPGVQLPPPGIFPSIDFSVRTAAPGDTITVTGVNFPTNSDADVFITPLLSLNAYTVIGQTTTSATGTINFALPIPTNINGAPLQGNAFSVLIKTRATGYFGYNFFYNSRGY